MSSAVCCSSSRRPACARSSAYSLPLTDAREGFAAMALGEQFGKIVFTI